MPKGLVVLVLCWRPKKLGEGRHGLRTILALLLFVAALGSSHAAAAAGQGFNGLLAYTDGDYNAQSIYGNLAVIRPSGTGRVLLPGNSSLADVETSWSPNGTWITYLRDNFGSSPDKAGIWRVRPDGSSREQLTSAVIGWPTWSPDGSKIAYLNYDPIDGLGVYTMNADGSNQERLVSFSGLSEPEGLAWSPDGTQFATSEASGGIYLISASDGSLAPVISGVGTHPTWSPDGSKLAFSNGNILTVNTDGSNVTPLTTTADDDDFPTWSPDGTKIAFETGSIGSYSALAVVNPDGTGFKRITGHDFAHSDPDWQPLPLTLSSSKKTVDYGKAVRLSGRLYWADTLNRSVSIYRVPSGGSKQLLGKTTLTDAGAFSLSTKPSKKTTYIAEWSGDGEHLGGSQSVIVFVRARADTWLSGNYGKSGPYNLFHFGELVHQTGRVAPNHAGKRLYFFAQLRQSGRWKDVASDSFRLGPKSTVKVTFGGGRGAYRTRVLFQGDADHLRDISAWAYFKIT